MRSAPEEGSRVDPTQTLVEHFLMQPTVLKIAEVAPIATYGGTALSVTFWGLHINEICAIISTCIAFCGLALQMYLAWHRAGRPRN